MKITWLGQSGYLLESEGKRLITDPFYSDIVEQLEGVKRMTYPPIDIKELHPDYIFITHDHIDHFDPVGLPQIHQQFPEAVVIGPESVGKKAAEHFFNKEVVFELQKEASKQFGPFLITSMPAYHSDPFAVGCLIECEGLRIYMSGDTLLTATLIDDVKRVAGQHIDLVFIVINGRLGNMNLEEAVFVVTQLRPRLAIPMHYGMFAENTADPEEFQQACSAAHIPCTVLALGESFDTSQLPVL